MKTGRNRNNDKSTFAIHIHYDGLSTKFEISLILSAVILYGIFSIYFSSVLAYFPKMLYSKVSVIE